MGALRLGGGRWGAVLARLLAARWLAAKQLARRSPASDDARRADLAVIAAIMADTANRPEDPELPNFALLPDMAFTAVHGDPNAGNAISSSSGQLVLIDWDEPRVDHPWLDLGALGPSRSRLSGKDAAIAYQASVGWEVSTCWNHKPTYARRRLRELGWAEQ